MNFQIFSDAFLSKWLTKEDLSTFSSNNDLKLKAGMNWLTEINKSAFSRYDEKWKILKEKCIECMNTNCKEDYDWLVSNSHVPNKSKINTIIDDNKVEQAFKIIKFENIKIGKTGYEKIKNYHGCKKKCYEKINLINAIFARRYNAWSKSLNDCLTVCRVMPIERDTMLADCYSDCMIKHSYKVAEIEFYINYVYEKLVKEYDNNLINLPGVDLHHNYRFKEREFTPDLVRKFV
jgi:hypothetical protein